MNRTSTRNVRSRHDEQPDPPSLAAARAQRNESVSAEVAHLNQQVESTLNRLNTWLANGLDETPLTVEQMLRPPVDEAINLGDLERAEPAPERPPLFKRFGQAEKDYRQRQRAHDKREQQRQLLLRDALETHRIATAKAEVARVAHNDALPALYDAYLAGNANSIAQWVQSCIESEPTADGHRARVLCAYVPESRQLVVEFDVPSLDIVPKVVTYRHAKASGSITSTNRPTSAIRATYIQLLAQIVLRTLHRTFVGDVAQHINAISFSAYVDGVDLTTGRPIRPCLVSVSTTRERFEQINLAMVAPLACLNSLNASVSRNPAELVPVRPVAQLNMNDRRFVSEEDVISMLDQRPNLLELSPSEFESLITNLFAHMGLETRLTRASRDGGVDAVAFDRRPVVGGKVVIQAKRYKDTVGVSAVRDLYGTVLNEGAGKGVLVTTSGYGQAAFDFAAGKPLELLSGSHLLSLLEEHAGVVAKIERIDEVMIE